MAIERIGSVGTFNDALASSSTTVSVPADATLMVVGVAGFRATANYFSGSSVTIDGAAMTSIGSDASTSYFMGSMFYKINPATGSKSLAWTWPSAPTNGVLFIYAFYKGVNTSDLMRDSYGGVQDADDPHATDTLTAASGDMVIAWTFQYLNPSGEGIAWTNATEVGEYLYTAMDTMGGYAEASPSGNVVLTATYVSGADGGIIAMVLKPASAGGSTYSVVATAGVTASVTPVGIWRFPRAATAAMTASDSAKGIGIFPRAATAGMTLGATPDGRLVISRSIADGVSGTDSPTARTTLPKGVTDGVTASDTLNAIGTYPRDASAGMTVSDSPRGVGIFPRSATSGISLTDVNALTGLIVAQVTASVTATDTGAAQTTTSSKASDGITLSSGANPQISFVLSVTAALTATDLAEMEELGLILLSVSDGMVLTDTVGSTWTYSAKVADGVQFTEIVATAMQLLAAANVGVTVHDVAAEGASVATGKMRITLTSGKASVTITATKAGIDIAGKSAGVTVSSD